MQHGPAFIFPFNQQQAVVASAASVRPGSSKLNTSTSGGLGGAAGSANSATVSSATTAAVPALSFNYPNMGANETQYMAILQNNAFPYPIPAAVIIIWQYMYIMTFFYFSQEELLLEHFGNLIKFVKTRACECLISLYL